MYICIWSFIYPPIRSRTYMHTHADCFPATQMEVLLKKLQADNILTDWDAVSSPAVVHLLRRYMETLPRAVVPAVFFETMLAASEGKMQQWLLGGREMKSAVTDEVLPNSDQHRSALKTILGLILSIAENSVAAGNAEQVRDGAAAGVGGVAPVKVFAQYIRQAVVFFAPVLLRNRIDNDVLRQPHWEKLVAVTNSLWDWPVALGFKTESQRPLKRRKRDVGETERLSRFLSDTTFKRILTNYRTMATTNMKSKSHSKILPQTRQPLVEVREVH